MSTETATGRKRAAIYLRVSTLKQARTDDADGYSLPAQQESCQRKAEQLNADVVEIYPDRGESAKTSERPQFQRMLARIRDVGDIDYVIVDKIDRFARNRRDDANLLFELRAAGVQLVSVKENIDESASGQLLHAVMAGIAEFYSKNLATETMKGMTQKAIQGGTPGRAPLGYLNTRRRLDNGSETRTVVLDPDRAPLIQWAYEAYASGEWTVRTLAEALAARGLRGPAIGSKPAVPIQGAHVHRILTNRYYIGKVKFNGAEYDGQHQSLVADSLFDRVQELLASRNRAGEKQRIHHHYLKGSVFCADCGFRMCIINAKQRYTYFYCLGRHQRRSACQQRYMPIEQVEAAVERFYSSVRMPDDVAESIRTGLRIELDQQHRRSQPELAHAKKRVVELEQERRRLARAVVSGAIPEDLALEEQHRVAAELKQSIAIQNTAEMIYARIEDTLTTALRYVTRVDEVYRLGGPQVRRLSNQFFFSKLLLTWSDDGDVEVAGSILNEPWATLLAEDFQKCMAENTTNPGRVRCGRGSYMKTLVPPAGFEPALLPPEGSALSPELRGPFGPANRTRKDRQAVQNPISRSGPK
jgi:site-specific DNA recombinase